MGKEDMEKFYNDPAPICPWRGPLPAGMTVLRFRVGCDKMDSI